MNLPDKQDIYQFIKDSPKPLTKREIVRAFGIRGDDRIILKKILRGLEEEGVVVKQGGGTYSTPNGLPSVGVVQITEIDIDGDVFATPVDWDESTQGPPPRIEIVPDKKGHPALKEQDRVLVRLKRYNDELYEAQVIRQLDDKRGRIMGVITQQKNGFILQPTHKKAKYDFDIPQKDLNGGKDGDLAIGEIQPTRGLKRKKVRIVDVIGDRNDPKAFSLIALHEAGLHEDFLDHVIEATENLTVPPLGKREDLRKVPLVTIDGADARDFDDAVFAEKTDNGFHLIVAIADVAHYVRPDSVLDKEAYRRGNSTYFPDRVVPMLPEALSNDLCSLRPHEDRACLAFHLWIDNNGQLVKHKVVRALMRSHARLIYEQVQAAKDGVIDDMTEPLMKEVITPLYEAYSLLDKARIERGALDLDLPERQIIINDKGVMTGVKTRQRLDAHKLIEEFMILANVAAAEALEKKKAPCMYRIHDMPSLEKLDSARQFIEAFGLSLPKGQVIRPQQINQLLKKAASMPQSHLISEVILRTQSQAIYHPKNIGHFGLALRKYAHFTSPIRRYADLLVHRSLIRAYGLGAGGLGEEEGRLLEEKADHISQTERTSMEAERATTDRFTAQFLSQHIGSEFEGKINGVTRFGLFISLNESGADGLIPIRSLPEDFYVHDEQQHALIGRRKKRIYRLGAPVNVRIMEADGLTGSSIFELTDDKSADIPGIYFKPPKNQPRTKSKFKRGKSKKRRR